MKKTITNKIELELQEGKTYKTKLATGEKFTIHKIEKNIKGIIMRVLGVYENSPHLLNCPLDPERLIKETTFIEEKIEACKLCGK